MRNYKFPDEVGNRHQEPSATKLLEKELQERLVGPLGAFPVRAEQSLRF
jgi:hypothetical protein